MSSVWQYRWHDDDVDNLRPSVEAMRRNLLRPKRVTPQWGRCHSGGDATLLSSHTGRSD
jgi:hypothetical protein